LHSEIHKLSNSIWNREELPQQWKEFIIVRIYKKSDKTDCSNCRGISLLLTTYVDEIIGDNQCGFQRNRSTTDHIFCIHQILEKSGSIIGQYTSCL
jgi:hypothetical protein